MDTDTPLKVECGAHGKRTAATICVHMLLEKDKAVGFIENSSDPDNLQAWCDLCEEFFLREQDKTAAFIEFNDMHVVCDFCYAGLKTKHSRHEDQGE